MHNWVVWCRSKTGAVEIISFELSGKEILSNYDETKSKEEKNKKNGGAGYVNLRTKRKSQQRKVGHEEEESTSYRPELAAFVLALRGTPVTNHMLYLCDNQALLKAVKRQVGDMILI